MMDGWALKCFYCLVYLCDEMCGLEVVRDGMDRKWIKKKNSGNWVSCSKFSETKLRACFVCVDTGTQVGHPMANLILGDPIEEPWAT